MPMYLRHPKATQESRAGNGVMMRLVASNLLRRHGSAARKDAMLAMWKMGRVVAEVRNVLRSDS